ncbi:prenyltransferase/squalene oxidase repeat-containing protein [Thermococcus alcaliphilus]|uniref:prenyltransferase/squalene oxidase repeat-containing protein n=1 Tax=Thermococcus alcaliphilus TaxID=139207 RepID=UPI002090E1C5|nr:prenyltransferase/squalene oxidase repeat-containing protein [Thermococcus alcaliphilus]MCO6041945.1 hypothetical protein [Thermococcus alcaliphilus]
MGSKLENYVDLRSVLKYIEDRRHEDGGYCFVSLLNETNVNDTYYAVKIYDLLDIEIPEKEKTVEFLYNSLKPQQAVVAIAMAIEGLAILGAKDLAKEGLSLVFEKYKPLEGKFAVGLGGSEEFGTATPLEATYWVLRAFKAIDYKVSSEERRKIRDFIESFRKGDGYGVTQATTTMTYQAIFSLNALGYPIPKTRHFHRCEVYGGFTEVPYSLPPYLEPTFYAVRGLRLINEKPRYIEPHIRFIRALQNPNGGFRRSLEMGISNFQNTYRALRTLDDLLNF